MKINQIIQKDIDEIVNEHLDFTVFKDANVLITGANGMIGSYLVYSFLKMNDLFSLNINVIGMVRNREKAERILFGILDRADFSLLVKDVSEPVGIEGCVDYIFHTASQASPQYFVQDPVGTFSANTLGTVNMLNLAKESGTKQFVYISSVEAYGAVERGVKVVEESYSGYINPLLPRSCYPQGKRAAETACVCFEKQYNIKCKIARLGYTYGPGMAIDDGRVQADFMRNIVENKDVILKSPGNVWRAYIYVKDAVSALFYMVVRGNDTAYTITNNDCLTTIRGLAYEMIGAFPEKELNVVFENLEDRLVTPIKADAITFSTRKLEGIGWKPTVLLKEGIKRTYMYATKSGM